MTGSTEVRADAGTASSTVDFLLAEYSGFRDQRATLIQSIHNEITIFLAAVTAIAVAFGFALDPADTPDLMKRFKELAPTAAIVVVIVIAIGYATLYRLTHFHANSIRYARGMNLIRAYFKEKDGDLANYLSLPVDPEQPRYELTGPWRKAFRESFKVGGVILILNISLAGTLGYTLSIVFASPGRMEQLIAASLFAITMWLAQFASQRAWMRTQRQKFCSDASVAIARVHGSTCEIM